MSGTRMEFRVLGPLEVWDGEDRLMLGSARQRALLGTLLLHPDEVVATDRLAAALWGQAPPERAETALRAHVTALRRVLEPQREKDAPSMLLRSAHGYRLSVDPDRVDLCRFRRLVEEGRRAMSSDPVTASALLHRAASLWRGPALADLTLAGAVAAECARLDELRIAAVEDRLHADLELGRHAAVVAELEALVAAHPLRERLLAQRMLALHRCGRDADALAAYRDARRHVEPSPDLRSLERAILEQDPALAAPAPAPADTVIATVVRGGEAATTVVASAPPAAGGPAPVSRGVRPRGAVSGAAALLVAAGVLGGGALHTLRAGTPAQSTTATAAEAFPNAREQLLVSRFAPVVSACHRSSLRYPRALADVECRVRADHPGASTLRLQSFAGLPDLEMHFHHVLALTIQDETHRPVTEAYRGDCADPGSGFFALSNHQRQGAATANGHLMCYVDHAGVPRLAWTDVSRLTVAQATGGTGAPAEARAGLLAFWRNLYPDEITAAQLAAAPAVPTPTAATGLQVVPVTRAAVVSRRQPSATAAPTPAARPHPTAGAATPAPTPGRGGHGSGWDSWDAFLGRGHD